MADYDLQAARIAAILAACGVTARVEQVDVRNPRWLRYQLTVLAGTRLRAVAGLEEELALGLGLEAVRVSRAAGLVNVDVPRAAPQPVRVADLLRQLPAVPPNCALLGIDEAGGPLLARLDSPEVAHVLIAGTTGSGKTALLRTMLLSLALGNPPGRLQLALIDPKRANLAPFSGLAHCWGGGLAAEPATAAVLIARLVTELERRGVQRLPRIVLALDELADLAQAAPAALAGLTRLLARGREAGIHVLAATQRPAAALVGGLLKANFPLRLVGKVTSAEESKLAGGLPGLGAERLLGRGDFLAVAGGAPIRFQAAYADGREQAQLLAAIAAGGQRRRGRPDLALPADAPALAERVLTLAEPASETPPVATGCHRNVLVFPAPPIDAAVVAPTGGTELEQPETIRQLAARGCTRNEICRAVFGYKDARTLGRVAAVLGPA